MKRISAAENLVVEMPPGSWRLLMANDSGEEQVLLEVVPDQPLRFSSLFASTRRLPMEGILPVDFVWQVILGWSYEDEAWHLGLLVAHDLADARGSRWCEIANWPDPDRTVFIDLAKEAGQSLARTLSRPFNLIPPRPKPEVEQPPLPDLPASIGEWSLKQLHEDKFELARSSKWIAARFMRAMWYGALAIIYAILSVSTLRSDLALPNAGTMLPNPELLPYLGLATTGVLILTIFYLIYQIFTKADHIIVDGSKHRVVGLRSDRKRWNINASDIKSVYVTQVVERKADKLTIHHGEINLYLVNGGFHRLVEQSEEEILPADAQGDEELEEAVVPLSPGMAITDLQAAGLHIARVMGDLPCWYDQRTR